MNNPLLINQKPKNTAEHKKHLRLEAARRWDQLFVPE